jgi:hypothetical protein
MTQLRADGATREAAGWAAFTTALERIPRERWEAVGVMPGWTVKDLLWHVAGWLVDCAGQLEAMREGRRVEDDATDEQTDARNAQLAAEARTMDLDAVWSGLLEARALVLRRWGELPEVDQTALDELELETWGHYEEHLPHLEAFAG